MRIVSSLVKVSIVFFLLTRTCFAVDITDVIAASVRNTKIISVELATIPHDDSMILAINTSGGMRNLIVTKENIPVALAALKNPQVTGIENAAISDNIIQNGPLLAFIAPPPAIQLASNPPVPNAEVVNPAMQTQEPTMMPESAPSEVAATIASANQQASR
jgi:hypothetical protein